MQMLRKILLLLSLLCAACATTAKYENLLENWKGKTLDDLVLSWGPPQNSFTLSDGRRVIEYYRQESVTTGDLPTYIPYRSGYYPLYSPPSSYDLQCRTVFVVSIEGQIVSWRWEGNNCKAK